MKKVWFDEAWADYLYWQRQDKKMLKRINRSVARYRTQQLRWDRQARTVKRRAEWILEQAD